MATFHANLVQSFKNFKNKYIGNTSIAGIGDGTLTSAVSEINQHLTDKVSYRTHDSYTPTASINNNATAYAVSTIKKEQNDICICRTTKDVALFCQPFVNSSGYWCCVLYNISGSTISANNFDVIFEILSHI